jgi:hypothetical protein
MTRDTIKAAALRELAKHGHDEIGGSLAAALGRVSLAYDLWVDRGRKASAELLIDAALDAVDAIHATAAGKAGVA